MKKILVLAFLLRAFFVILTADKILPEKDAAQYDSIAVNLIEHGEYSIDNGTPTSRRSPLYPFFLAGIYFIFGHKILVVKLIQAVIGTATCLYAYKISRALFNDELAAKLSALTVAVYPFFIYYTAFLLIETLFTFLLTLIVFHIVKNESSVSSRESIILGLIFALAVLCKPTAYPFFMLYVIILLSRTVKDKKNLKKLVVMLILFVPVVSLWGYRNYRIMGKFDIAYSGGIKRLYLALASNDPADRNSAPPALQGDSGEWDFYVKKFTARASHNPLLLLKSLSKELWDMWRPYPKLRNIDVIWSPGRFIIITGFLFYDLLLLLSALSFLFYRHLTKEMFIILIPVASFSLTHMFMGSIPRYNRPVMPFVIILASLSLSLLIKKTKMSGRLESYLERS